MKSFEKTSRNKVKRLPKRGHYDKATIYEILDAGFVCHVGFVVDDQPFVIPTGYGRDGDIIYLHGSTKSRLMLAIKAGAPVCITVTHLDGLVLARSTFHHSMNYRSAVVFGKGEEITGEEKMKALEVVTENILKGRWNESRPPNAKELKATMVIGVKIEEATAKIRTGPPGDEKEDYALPIWAGVVPMETVYRKEMADPMLDQGIPVSQSVLDLRNG